MNGERKKQEGKDENSYAQRERSLMSHKSIWYTQ